jgi:cell division protein FtsQ
MKQEVQQAPKRRVSKPRAPMQPVVYTQPKVFNRNRLIIQLASVVAVVLAMVLCLSIFFRVETITVSGANAYSAWEIREASGIQEGDRLLTFSKARACAKIKAEKPYVDTVRIGIKLPDTVNIVIEEIDVVYAIQDQDGIWWLMTSEGKVMDQTDTAGASTYTKVLGVKLSNPQKDQQAVAFQNLIGQPQATEENQPEGETQAPTPLIVTEQQKLGVALEILQAMELNEIVGEAASVDVSDLTRIELWYGTRYQVNLGENVNMDYKIACLKGAVNKLSDYDSGELDISFTTWPDKVTYTPFN